MSIRKWLAGSVLLLLSTGLVFANGDKDEGYPMRGGGPRNGTNREVPETRTVEGTFSMVDGEYPAVITADGKTFYLMMRFGIRPEDIPAEGAALSVEGIQSPMSPDLLMVVYASVEGREWSAPGFEDGEYCGPEAYAGGRGGMMGGQSSGRGGMGGPGPKSGWGYSDTPKN